MKISILILMTQILKQLLSKYKLVLGEDKLGNKYVKSKKPKRKLKRQ